jgi:hypothetical protein
VGSGGRVANITAYKWVGDAETGFLDVDNPVTGGDCDDDSDGGDNICATVNKSGDGNGGTIHTPWPTANKDDGVGTNLRTGEFFEGGVNLTESGLGDKCFNTFLANTRASTSPTSDLEDFSRGQLGECTSDITTTPKKADGTTTITSEPIPATGRLEVKDSALIEVTGVDTFSADVTFFLCGPGELTSATDVCDSGGVQIGDPVAVTANGTVTSGSAFLTSAGRYCWRADFSGDESTGVPSDSDSSEGECFTVTPLQPTLVTDATDSPVPFGESITDVVTLSGTANQEGTDGPAAIEPTINATRGGGAGGTISVTVFGPDSCSTVAHGPVTLAVNGDGSYGGADSALEFTPTAPGEYVFVASYSGDDPNTLGVAATACADQPAKERVTVEQIPTDIKTKQSWFPNDTATVSATAGNLGADGTVRFELFTNATCEGTAVYDETVDVTGGSPSEEVSTSNDGTSAGDYEITTDYTDAADSTVGVHSWRVTYEPNAADTSHTGSRSTCHSEHFDITYTNDPGPGTDLQ